MDDVKTQDGDVASLVGGRYNATPPTAADSQFTALQVDTRGNLRITFGPGSALVSAVGDALVANNNAILTANEALVFNGSTWDRQRTPNVFKVVSLTITAGTPQAIWTPAAGKKFRLMGFCLGTSVTTNILLEDNSAASVITRIATTSTGAGVPSPPMGNGIPSAAVNNILNLDMGGSGTVNGIVFGVEE